MRYSAVAALSLLLLASCSGGSSKSIGSRLASGQDVSADTAAAEAANLKAGDFPAQWTSFPHRQSPHVPSVDEEMTGCLRTHGAQLVVDGPVNVRSPDFFDPDKDRVASRVTYYPTASAVKQGFTLLAQPWYPRCVSSALATYERYLIAHPSSPAESLPAGMTVGPPVVESVSFPRIGDADIAYRVVLPISAPKISLPGSGIESGGTIDSYGDLVLAIRGRALVTMSFDSVGGPFSGYEEEHYTQLVVDRLART